MTSPVIETNIERILEDHLFHEVDLLDVRTKQLQDEVKAIHERKQRLLRIAEAAGITRGVESNNSEIPASNIHRGIP